MSKKQIFGVFAGAVGLITFIFLLALLPFTVIQAGHRGVVTNFGTVKNVVLNEGFHIISPFDHVTKIDVRTQKAETASSAASSDLQTVTTEVVVNYHLIPETVNDLYQNVGLSYNTTVIAPAIQDSIKAATAQFTAEELITKRAEVSNLIETNLAARISRYSVVESVAIVNFDFSESFNAAIEAKVTAEQNALAAKNKLEQTKYEAEQVIVKAQAEAESIRIQAEALQGNQDLVALETVRKWNGVLPTYVLGDSVPLLNIGQ